MIFWWRKISGADTSRVYLVLMATKHEMTSVSAILWRSRLLFAIQLQLTERWEGFDHCPLWLCVTITLTQLCACGSAHFAQQNKQCVPSSFNSNPIQALTLKPSLSPQTLDQRNVFTYKLSLLC